jgi:uncharacterized membrane protein YdjX (TVP38/TMEM64 family)
MTSEREARPVPASHAMRTSWRRFTPLALVVAGMVAVWGFGWHRNISLEAIAVHRDTLQAIVSEHRVLALLGYIAAYTAFVGLSLPGGTVMTLAGGLLFGWLGGALAAVFGATSGATVIFLIARTAAGDLLAAKAGPMLRKLQQGFQQNALSYMLFLRLVPAFPFWLVNLAPALFDVPLRTYLIGTFIGIIPGTLAIASVGAGLDAIIATAKADLAVCVARDGADSCELSISAGALLNKELIVATVLLGFTALLPIVINRMRAGRP